MIARIALALILGLATVGLASITAAVPSVAADEFTRRGRIIALLVMSLWCLALWVVVILGWVGI